MKRSQYESWVNVLALLFFLEGLLLLGIVLLFSSALSTIASVGWGRWSLLAWSIFAFAMVFVMLRFAAAYGLWKRMRWARIFAAAIGIIGILGFPLGTAIGALSIWLLLVEKNAEQHFG